MQLQMTKKTKSDDTSPNSGYNLWYRFCYIDSYSYIKGLTQGQNNNIDCTIFMSDMIFMCSSCMQDAVFCNTSYKLDIKNYFFYIKISK